MKANVSRLSTVSKKAIASECRRTLVELTKQYEIDLDTTTLWVLHKEFGFGKKRLQRFYDLMFSMRRDMQDFFEDKEDSGVSELCMRSFLKQDGIDVEEMYNTQDNAKRFKVKLS